MQTGQFCPSDTAVLRCLYLNGSAEYWRRHDFPVSTFLSAVLPTNCVVCRRRRKSAQERLEAPNYARQGASRHLRWRFLQSCVQIVNTKAKYFKSKRQHSNVSVSISCCVHQGFSLLLFWERCCLSMSTWQHEAAWHALFAPFQTSISHSLSPFLFVSLFIFCQSYHAAADQTFGRC